MHNAERLARLWIESWNAGTPDQIPLADDFSHTSPFGTVTGRTTYLDWVKPLAAENVAELTIVRVLASEDEATIHFEMKTPSGIIQVCDWVKVAGEEIVEIHSFYDATELKKG